MGWTERFFCCLKRERDIGVKTIIPSQNTAFRLTPPPPPPLKAGVHVNLSEILVSLKRGWKGKKRVMEHHWRSDRHLHWLYHRKCRPVFNYASVIDLGNSRGCTFKLVEAGVLFAVRNLTRSIDSFDEVTKAKLPCPVLISSVTIISRKNGCWNRLVNVEIRAGMDPVPESFATQERGNDAKKKLQVNSNCGHFAGPPDRFTKEGHARSWPAYSSTVHSHSAAPGDWIASDKWPQN